MSYLIDTNVLLRFADRQSTQHSETRNAIASLKRSGEQLFVTSQNCIEFWNVATRPAQKNGFGFSISDADFLLGLIERIFPRLPDTSRTYDEWRTLVVDLKVSGVQVHDARIAAAMIANGIPNILTFNTKDFARYSKLGINAVSPSDI